LIVEDEFAGRTRANQPPDPNWKPEVILTNESAGLPTGTGTPGSPETATAYRSLVEHISTRTEALSRENASSDWSQLLRALLALVFVIWLVGTIWLCIAIWTESNQPARDDTLHPIGGSRQSR
jgi:cobalamin biosynthesis Mg chelatase CobN